MSLRKRVVEGPQKKQIGPVIFQKACSAAFTPTRLDMELRSGTPALCTRRSASDR